MSTQKTIFPPPILSSTHVWDNKTVGILGGSFNPVHEGHIHISHEAIKKMPIDCLWWCFTPGNPFKKHISIPSVQNRINEAKKRVNHPKIIMSDIEEQLCVDRTYQLIQQLNRHFPKTRFIWIGGMDLPEEFHKWEKWKDVLGTIPVVFFKRPPYKGTIKRIPLKYSKDINHVYKLPKSARLYKKNHIYWCMDGATRQISSSQIRQKIGKNA